MSEVESPGETVQALVEAADAEQYVLVVETDEGWMLSDHYATPEEVDEDADLQLLAQYLIDRQERTGTSQKDALVQLVEAVNERRSA